MRAPPQAKDSLLPRVSSVTGLGPTLSPGASGIPSPTVLPPPSGSTPVISSPPGTTPVTSPPPGTTPVISSPPGTTPVMPGATSVVTP